MGKLQLVIVNVEGDSDVLKDALSQIDRVITRAGDDRPDAALPLPPALPVSDVGATSRSPSPANRAKGSLDCRHCGKTCGSPQGRGKHESSCKAAPTPQAPANDKPFKCDECGAGFRKVGWRDKHIEKEHPEL